jgi:acyl-CoA reductase-like NAD-dependent aldehyde dehydrogenase
LVQQEIHDLLVERLADRFLSLVVGPADGNPDVGPLVSEKQLDRVRTFVDEAVSEGAEIAAQATVDFTPSGSPSQSYPSPDSPSQSSHSLETLSPDSSAPDSSAPDSSAPDFPYHGFFYPPTLLTHVDPQSTIARKEVFGPVLVVIPFRDEEEAIRLANDVEYGLVAAVWTENLGRAHRVADAIDAGQVYVNGYGAGGGVELPFGGMKKSGFGREKGFEALHEVTAVKTYVINKG